MEKEADNTLKKLKARLKEENLSSEIIKEIQYGINFLNNFKKSLNNLFIK